MSAPTPAPRTLVNKAKQPVPAPRSMVSTKSEKETDLDGKNTFTRRVRTLSNASKQIAGDIGDKVQEGKKAVIQSTRQSVRRITKRFTNNFNEVELNAQPKVESSDTSSESCDVFNSIRFNSPIHVASEENVYNVLDPTYENTTQENIYANDADDDDYEGQPPPPYPPPVLREEVYDKPNSLASGSTTSSENLVVARHKYDYESVFPLYPYNSDSESCVDMTSGTIDRNVVASRSFSFNFYDALPKQENDEPVYKNLDNTPVLKAKVDGSVRTTMRNNSLYENHIIREPPESRPSQSVLLEFDPLINNNQLINTHANNLKELEQVLVPTCTEMDNISVFEYSSDSEEIYISPPPPPTRFDSLPEEPIMPSSTEGKSKCSWFTSGEQMNTKVQESGPRKWLNKVNEVLKMAPELVKSGNRNKDSFLQRPTLMPRGIIQQKGMLYKITKGPVEEIFGEFSSRWCTLQSGLFLCHSDNTCENVRENFPMESIMSVQILQDQKFKYRCENDELHCFELNIAGNNRSGHIYGSKNNSERRVWMQKLAESLTGRFGVAVTSNYSRIGWAYIREGLSGQWMGAWLVLTKRRLLYAFDNSPVKSLDLRKARCFTLEPLQVHGNTPCTSDKGPNIVIHFTSGTFYFRMWTQRETKVWCHIIKISAKNNGPKLDEQQLTRNEVPVIVEKCINFVYAYGSMEEGIYRKSGSSAVVADLMRQFGVDAWAVQLTDKYKHHDVATALKRFFRDLSEPLIEKSQKQYLYQVSLVKSREDRVRMYKGTLDQFSPIAHNTIRTLLGHLYFISTQSDKNLMSIDNLAAVWGPTLLHSEGNDFSKEHQIVAQLIDLHKYIFPEDAKEAEQERKMLSVLEKCAQSPQGVFSQKASGDFRVWVYLFNKDGRTFNILIGPHKTAYEILCELSPKINIPVHELVLEELVLNDNLTRPIHHTEKVLDVVLKWGYWEEADRKDNCLILNNISKYWEYINENTLPLSAELKYADSKTKQLKPCTFEFLQAKLSCYKDKSCTNLLASWNIEDINWYFGHESKRSPPSKYTVTFIEKKLHPKRTKVSSWFGNIICWNEPALRAMWLAAMWRAEHPNNLTPPPQLVNLMTA